MKTNAARILDRLAIEYELKDYDVDPEDLSAETVARKVGMPLARTFKTLVCRGDTHGVCFAIVAGDCELDLKALARASGDRKVETVALKELQALTGYVRGGVTVLGAKKAYPAYVDASALEFERISVSAGARGTQIFLSPVDYVRATGARVVERLGRAQPPPTK